MNDNLEPIYIHPTFGSYECPICSKLAELRHNILYKWWCCGVSTVVVGSVMDVANELIWASLPDDEK